MQKSRVDLVRHVTIPSVPIHSRKTFPLHTEVTETVKSPSNNEGILTTSGGDASVSVTDSDTSVQRSDPKDSLSATVGTSPQLDLPDSHQTSDVNIEVGQNESNGNILEDVITSGGRFRVLDSLPDNPKEQPLPEKVFPIMNSVLPLHEKMCSSRLRNCVADLCSDYTFNFPIFLNIKVKIIELIIC